MAADRAELFEQIKPWLLGDPDVGAYARGAARMDMTQPALRIAVSRLRRRYGDWLRQEISHTVSTTAEVVEELRHLFDAMSGAGI